MKNTHGGLLLLVKLQAEACNFTKSNSPPWVFFTILNCMNSTKSRNAPQMLQDSSCTLSWEMQFWSMTKNDRDNYAFLPRPYTRRKYRSTFFPCDYLMSHNMFVMKSFANSFSHSRNTLWAYGKHKHKRHICLEFWLFSFASLENFGKHHSKLSAPMPQMFYRWT